MDKELSDRELLELALEAIEIADNIMAYCGGDAWERECTQSDRSRFDDIYAKLFPQPVTMEQRPARPSGRVQCAHCGKKLSGAPDAIKQHCQQIHPGMPAQSRASGAAEIGKGVA